MFENKKVLILGAVATLLIIIIILLFAIKPKQDKILVDNTPVSLKWRIPFDSYAAAYEQAITKFKELPGNENTTIEIETGVKYEGYGENYELKLKEDLALDSGPDMFMLRNDELPKYLKFMTPIKTPGFDLQKKPLTSERMLADYQESFVPLVVRETVSRGEIYGIASFVENLQMYYNKNLLEQAGIAIPAKTWSEMDRHAKLLNKRDTSGTIFNQSAISLGTGFKDQNGAFNIHRFMDIMPLMIIQAGGQLYDYQTNTPVFGQPKNTQDLSTGTITNQEFDITSPDNIPTANALEYYLSYGDINSARYSYNGGSNYNVDMFADGKLAYMIDYSYIADKIKEKNTRLQFNISEIPQLGNDIKKTFGYFFMTGLSNKMERDAVADKTKIRKLGKAREFMYYLSQTEAQESFVTKLKLPSARLDILKTQIESGDRVLRIFANGSLIADNYYKADPKKVEKIWGDLVYRVQYEKQTLADALGKAVTEYNTLNQEIKQSP
jgi:ABC-type glycerol-3-phosphate transport system substrate-binding protein